MKRKILVRGPALSRSGYGEQTRFALRSLRQFEDKFDIFLINTSWGKTGWIHEDNEERDWLDKILGDAINHQQNGGSFDVSIQVTIPNEWEKLAPINIGYTAGIETTRVAPVWLEKAALMDNIIVVSNHSKDVFENTGYRVKNEKTGQEFDLKCNTPISVVNYPVRFFEQVDMDLQFETDFNFLVVAQMGPRKNVPNTIRWFLEEFKNDADVGLVLKIFTKNNSQIDKTQTEKVLKDFVQRYPEKKCKVYCLHGDVSDEELTTLYNHPKIKSLVSLSHGEGYGLPLFEAAYNGLPVITSGWSGQCDFLFAPVNKKGKIRNKAHFANVDYTLGPIQQEAVWDNVLQKDSMWCYPLESSFKTKAREVYKDYGRFKSQAKKLKENLLKNFSEEKLYTQFVDAMDLPEMGVAPSNNAKVTVL